MKLLTCICVLLSTISCKSITAQNDPQKIFQEHIKVIECLLKGEEVHNLKSTVEFLEETTDIKSEVDFGWEIMYSPTDQNLKDWKDWFKKNKNRLYWDEKEQKVKVKEKK